MQCHKPRTAINNINMRLLGLSLLCLLVTGKKGRPESPKREGPETVSPDEGSIKPQEEDGNEKDQTDKAG